MDEVSDPRVGFLRSDVERFCRQLDGLAPALRMRLLEEGVPVVLAEKTTLSSCGSL